MLLSRNIVTMYFASLACMALSVRRAGYYEYHNVDATLARAQIQAKRTRTVAGTKPVLPTGQAAKLLKKMSLYRALKRLEQRKRNTAWPDLDLNYLPITKSKA